MLLLIGSTFAAPVPEPPAAWWDKSWPYRVRIDCPAGDGDVVQATVHLSGRSTPDGRDLRLVDAAGKPVAFEILYHDPAWRTLLRLQAPSGKAQTAYLYYGNTKALTIATTKISPDAQPWEVKRGLILRVFRKAKPGHPKTLADLREMVRKGTLEGVVVKDNISDGYNPVGTSEDYISVYEGYLNIDTAGSYAFCSASKDGSWIVIDGRTLVEWPGPHGWGGAEHGEHNGVLNLAKGVHLVHYFQEAGQGGQLAFMGWKAPGDKAFGAIPAKQWLPVRTSHVRDYEAKDQPVLAVPDVEMTNTYWVRDSAGQQTTLVTLIDRSVARSGKIAKAHWNFGDGLDADGTLVQHVYLRLGRPQVKLTVTDDKGNSDSAVVSPRLFLVDVTVPTAPAGNAEQHGKIIDTYDLTKLDGPELDQLAWFWFRLEKWSQGVAATRAYLKRFPDSLGAGPLAAQGAQACLEPMVYDPALAEQLFNIAIPKTADAEAKQRLMLWRGRNLVWGLNDAKQAGPLLKEVIAGAQIGEGKPGKLIARAAQIALGDVALLGGDYDKARDFYKKAEETPWRRSIDQAEALARKGTYPFTVEDYLARGEYEAAMKTVEEWEEDFPLQKLEGLSFFWRGKVLFVQHPSELAVRYLQLAELVNPKGTHVAEAVWLRANCLMGMEKYPEALAAFGRIRSDFTTSEYYKRAEAKIKECEAKIKPVKGKGG